MYISLSDTAVIVDVAYNEPLLMNTLYVGRQTEFYSNCVKLSGLSGLGHWFLFLCFRSEKIQNLKREGGKKNI